jgi:hypothetical protein
MKIEIACYTLRRLFTKADQSKNPGGLFSQFQTLNAA